MYACVYVHVYICMYVCMCMYVCIYVCMYVYVCIYVYVCMYVCMYAVGVEDSHRIVAFLDACYMYARMFVCAMAMCGTATESWDFWMHDVCMYVCVRIIHISTYIHARAHTHAHSHTYIHWSSLDKCVQRRATGFRHIHSLV